MHEETAIYPSLRSLHVIVTGGASGIGAALVDSFCAQGAIVTFLDIDDVKAIETIRRVRAKGHAAPEYRRCDLTDIGALREAIAAAIERHGPVGALINNAAKDQRHDWANVTSADWDRHMNVNLKHHFFAIQAVAPSMAEAGCGSIVNFSSISWVLGMAGLPAYTTAKSAIVGLTRSMARELGAQNIRVNCVLPGWIITDRQRDLYLTPEAEKELLDKQSIKRLLMPEDMTSMVLFLAAADSAACTGQSFVVDGGWV